MKYNISKKEKDIVEVSIELGKDAWASALEKAYENTKTKYEVQGFRKGKAPRKAIENAYGSMVFVDEAIEVVYRENFMSIVIKEVLSKKGMGRVKIYNQADTIPKINQKSEDWLINQGIQCPANAIRNNTSNNTSKIIFI